MMQSLSFSSLIEYDPGLAGIEIPIQLGHLEKQINLKPKLDTGSANCIFERWYGELLGLDVEAGELKTFGTATGTFRAYGHWLTLTVEQYSFDVIVFFAKDHVFNRNVLGRIGFMQLVRLGVIDFDGKLYLSRRDDDFE